MPSLMNTGWGGFGGSAGWGGAGSYSGFGMQQGQNYIPPGIHSQVGGGNLYNTASQDFPWWAAQKPADAMWQSGMEAGPDALGSIGFYNQATHEFETRGRPGMSVGGNGKTYFSKSIDPVTGQVRYDTSGLSGMFSGLGGAGFKPWEGGGEYEAPAPWEQMMIDPGQMIDTGAVVESFRPRMQEEIARGFAEAGNRAGQSGFAMSTPYMERLGGVERKATNDMNNILAQYGYGAAEAQAARQMQAAQANAANNLAAWQTGGQWQHEHGLADLNNQFGAWQAENNWNQNNQQFMQSLMAQLMSQFG